MDWEVKNSLVFFVTYAKIRFLKWKIVLLWATFSQTMILLDKIWLYVE